MVELGTAPLPGSQIPWVGQDKAGVRAELRRVGRYTGLKDRLLGKAERQAGQGKLHLVVGRQDHSYLQQAKGAYSCQNLGCSDRKERVQLLCRTSGAVPKVERWLAEDMVDRLWPLGSLQGVVL